MSLATQQNETAGMTREELLALRTELQRQADGIAEDIAMRVAKYGKAIDMVWLAKANKAKRMKVRAINAINEEMGALRRKEKETRDRTVEGQFVKVAKQELPPEVFSRLLGVAMAQADQAHWELGVTR